MNTITQYHSEDLTGQVYLYELTTALSPPDSLLELTSHDLHESEQGEIVPVTRVEEEEYFWHVPTRSLLRKDSEHPDGFVSYSFCGDDLIESVQAHVPAAFTQKYGCIWES